MADRKGYEKEKGDLMNNKNPSPPQHQASNPGAPPYILCAAVHYDNGDGKIYHYQPKNIETGFVVCGRRHPDAILLMSTFSDAVEARTKEKTQGFITSDDRFVDRAEAGQIAYTAKQIKEPTDLLFSEDLY